MNSLKIAIDNLNTTFIEFGKAVDRAYEFLNSPYYLLRVQVTFWAARWEKDVPAEAIQGLLNILEEH